MYKRDTTEFETSDFERVLPTIASGSLANLTYLGLFRNQIGDDGMNQIGDDGMKAFSKAIISSGSLGSLMELYLYNNCVGREASGSLKANLREAHPQLKDLSLS